MVVKRIKDLDIRRRGCVTAIIGNTDDSFFDNDFCRYSFEEQLHLYLKNEGYKRIYFYTRAPKYGLYTYDTRKVLESLYPPNVGNNSVQDCRPLGGGFLKKKSNSGSENQNIIAEKPPSGGHPYFYISNFRDTALAEAIFKILNSVEDSVICFPSTKLEFREDQGLIAGIEKFMQEAAQNQSSNKIIIKYSDKEKNSFLTSLNKYSQGLFSNDIFINEFKSGNNLNNENIFMVELPDKKECENWINSMRIHGKIDNHSVFAFPFRTLVEQVTNDKETIDDLEKELQSNADIFLERHRVEEFSEELLAHSLSMIHGQQDNMKIIVEEIVTWVNSPDETKSPLVFMFAGTSGTGKTYTAKKIADSLKSRGFGFVRLDMNEYKTEMDSQKLLGSAPGYIGSDQDSPLFSARKENDRLVILFDEIDKAYSQIFQILMTLMDEGYLGNSRGENIDFRQSIIIFTSNLAMNTLKDQKKQMTKAQVPIDSYEFQEATKKIIEDKGIPTEVCGRIKCLLVYNTLGPEIVARIAIEEIRALGNKYGLQINNIPQGILKQVATHVANSNKGARPIKDYVQKLLERKLQIASIQLVKNKNYDK